MQFWYFSFFLHVSHLNWTQHFVLLKNKTQNLFNINNPNQKLYINAKINPLHKEEAMQLSRFEPSHCLMENNAWISSKTPVPFLIILTIEYNFAHSIFPFKSARSH